MKLQELNQIEKDELRFINQDFSGRREDISIPPTAMQMLRLRQAGYVIGPNQELLRITGLGLRECKHGMPCHYYCGGVADGVCTNIPFPSCGVADGACLFTGKPCHSGCEAKSQKMVQKELF